MTGFVIYKRFKSPSVIGGIAYLECDRSTGLVTYWPDYTHGHKAYLNDDERKQVWNACDVPDEVTAAFNAE